MAVTALVPLTAVSSHRDTSEAQASILFSTGRSSACSSRPGRSSGRVAYLREHYTSQKISDQATELARVLQYLSSQKVTKDTTLKTLTLKTVMLLALTRPSKSVDLAGLDISNCHRSPEGYTFKPLNLTKQARQGKKMAEFFFPVFKDDPNLRPVQSLEEYITRTKTRRKCSQLFISFIQPHGPATSSTIARTMVEGSPKKCWDQH